MFRKKLYYGLLFFAGIVLADVQHSPVLVYQASGPKVLYSQAPFQGIPLKTFILGTEDAQGIERKDFSRISSIPCFSELSGAFCRREATSLLLQFSPEKSFVIELSFDLKDTQIACLVVHGSEKTPPEFVVEFVKRCLFPKSLFRKSIEVAAKTVALVGGGAFAVAVAGNSEQKQQAAAVSTVVAIPLAGDCAAADPAGAGSLALAVPFTRPLLVPPAPRTRRMRYQLNPEKMHAFIMSQIKPARGISADGLVARQLARQSVLPKKRRAVRRRQALMNIPAIVEPLMVEVAAVFPVEDFSDGVMPLPAPEVLPEALVDAVLPAKDCLAAASVLRENVIVTPRTRRKVSKELVDQLVFKVGILDDIIKQLKARRKIEDFSEELLDAQIKRVILVSKIDSSIKGDKENTRMPIDPKGSLYGAILKWALEISLHEEDSVKKTLRGLTARFMDAHASAGNPIKVLAVFAQRRSKLGNKSLQDKLAKDQIINATAEIARTLTSLKLQPDGDFISF